MEIIQYNKRTFPKKAGAKMNPPFMSIHKKGSIYFNAEAVEMLGLKAGDTIGLGQSKTEKDNWYLYKDPNGFAIRRHNKATGEKSGMVTGHRALSVKLCRYFGLNHDQSQFFEIVPRPVKIKTIKDPIWQIKPASKNNQ